MISIVDFISLLGIISGALGLLLSFTVLVLLHAFPPLTDEEKEQIYTPYRPPIPGPTPYTPVEVVGSTPYVTIDSNGMELISPSRIDRLSSKPQPKPLKAKNVTTNPVIKRIADMEEVDYTDRGNISFEIETK